MAKYFHAIVEADARPSNFRAFDIADRVVDGILAAGGTLDVGRGLEVDDPALLIVSLPDDFPGRPEDFVGEGIVFRQVERRDFPAQVDHGIQ